MEALQRSIINYFEWVSERLVQKILVHGTVQSVVNEKARQRRKAGDCGTTRANAAKATHSRGTRAAGSPPCRARDVARLPTEPRTRAPQALGARAGSSAAPLSAARKSSCALPSLYRSFELFLLITHHKHTSNLLMIRVTVLGFLPIVAKCKIWMN